MVAASGLWMVFTVVAAAGQTARNAMQRELTASLGIIGATHVRFLFGFLFALLFLAGVARTSGVPLPSPGFAFSLWVLDGALAQVVATALMLAVMNRRSFVVATAYIKTEPVQVALFGFIFLGDALNAATMAAIVIATVGVMTMSLKRGVESKAGWRPAFTGIGAGAVFALSAIGYRGAILSLHEASFVMAATYTLAVGLLLQAALLSLYLWIRDRKVLVAILRNWRPSLFAGAMGALASEFWFLAFALTSAASVRTLGLVEVLFAQFVSHFVFKQSISKREALGIALLVIGVGWLISAQ